jgi:hypothetical protein
VHEQSLKSQRVKQELHPHARGRDHKCRKPHGFMNRASSWIDEKSRSRSRSSAWGRGRTWYKGESSHGRVVAHQELLSSVASDSVPNMWPPGTFQFSGGNIVDLIVVYMKMS